ncbi:MAG TPA: tripartite tricarboxylate transporter TctB family protein [Burkholderiaceae bacterium]|nr:tripartite tricarboxylate transporter TctB family protein [Burkholderiaceae bacterium]
MEKDRETAAPVRGAVSGRAVGAVTAIVFFLIGVVMIVDNYRIGAGWAPDGPEAGYFPLRIGVIICVAAVFVLVQALKGERGSAFVTLARLRHVLVVLVPTTLFVLAIKFLGIYVASAVFIAAFMRVMDRFSWLKTVVISIGVSATLFWLFELQFLVPLPKGPLEAMFGY